MVDLDAYDFTPGSGALIRATEATVQERIPPRARVRRNAPIELPHVMLLIDNPEKTVIEPLTAAAGTMEKVYDFDMMQGGGHIKGYKLSDKQIDAVADALEGLCSDKAQMEKYNLSGAAPCSSPWVTATTLWLPPRPAMKSRRRARPRGISRSACPLCPGRSGEQPR